MNRIAALFVKRTKSVDGHTRHIHQAPLYLFSHRHYYRKPCCHNFHSPLKSVSGVHCNCPYRLFSDVLLALDYKYTSVITFNFKCIKDIWHIHIGCVKCNVDHRSDNLADKSNLLRHFYVLM